MTNSFCAFYQARAPYSYNRRGNPNPLQQQQQQQQNLTGGSPSTIPPSKETKAKLNAFAFGGLTPRRKGRGSGGGKGEGGEGDGKEDIEGLAMTLGSEPMSDPTKECPQTPAPRLALSDLIGIGEEGKFPQPAVQSDVSPEDRIMWQLSPNGSQVTPKVKGKGQKRKRDIESPSGDVAAQDSPAQRKPGTLNLQDLDTDLRTPSADPATQLWSKYFTNTNSGSAAVRPVNPAARLFNGGEASQNGAPDLSPLGLRRSYSCGPDWPGHSRLKKRKINLELGSEASIAEEPTENPKSLTAGANGPGPSRLSRVSRLVDKVKETLGKPSVLPNLPSSSSPLPERHPNFELTSSPLGGGRLRARGSPSLGRGIALAEETAPVESSDSEDFGEFDEADIDMDMLEKVEELVRDSQSQAQAKPIVEDSCNPPVLARQQPVQPIQEISESFVAADGEDEFGDGDDDDFFTQNLEEIVAKFDTPAAGPTLASNLAGSSQTLDEQSPDAKVRDQADENAKFLEEFGEIDFDEWEEEELKITQGLVRIICAQTPTSSLIISRQI